MPGPNLTPESSRGYRPSRREFLRVSSLALAAAAAGRPVDALRGPGTSSRTEIVGRGNVFPGRIVLYHDPAMEGHLSTINKDRVEEVVRHGVCILTGIGDPATAFESLFPGLHAGTTIAIKVNCVGTADTRWETVRGVISGLSLMLGGSYNVGQVVIYDRDSILGNGYPPGEFTFGGNQPVMASDPNCSSTYYVYGSHRLSNYLLDSDYAINIPALKAHNRPLNQLTLAFKNHYGSCCPPSLCDNIPGMLSVNTDPHIKGKTSLVLMDGLRGTYSGMPTQPPQSWNTFPEQSPNTLFFSTDPVTNEYWGRDMINTERLTHGLSPKPAPWVEEASADPYNLGVSNPGEMTVIYHDPASLPAGGADQRSGVFLAPNVPNPFRDGTLLRFRLPRRMSVRLVILDASGRVVRTLAARHFPAGHSAVNWDGRSDGGEPLSSGVYFARLESGRLLSMRRIQMIR